MTHTTNDLFVPFDSHLLFPLSPDYAPLPAQVLRFFERLIEIGALPPEPAIRLRLPTEEEVCVRNARTGEKIATGMKRLKDAPANTLTEAGNHLGDVDQYVLTAKGSIAVSASCFDLRNRDGYDADPATAYVIAITCKLLARRTQLSESWHEHLRIFLLPQEKRAHACPRCGAIHESGEEVQPRFWVEFAFGGVYLPSFKEDSKIIDPVLYAAATTAFQTEFFHGRFFS